MILLMTLPHLIQEHKNDRTMKYLTIILGLLLLVAAMPADAQDITLTRPTYTEFLGAATDTLIESETLSYTVRLKGTHVYDINAALEITKVSGTVTNNWLVYYSMDGTNFVASGDTLAINSDASTSVVAALDLDDWNYPYIRFSSTAPATAQKASYGIHFICRYE